MKPTRNIMQFKLTDFLVEDLTENTLYQKILTIEDDKVFDFKVSYYLLSLHVKFINLLATFTS